MWPCRGEAAPGDAAAAAVETETASGKDPMVRGAHSGGGMRALTAITGAVLPAGGRPGRPRGHGHAGGVGG